MEELAARFVVCLPFTLRQECPLPDDWSNHRNYSNDPHDPGGATQCGITQREYDHYRLGKGLHTQSVRSLSRDEGNDIYFNSYWKPYCPNLPAGLDLCFFDTAVNEGPHAAVKILQKALDLEPDGTWGPATTLAVRGAFNLPEVVNAFTAARKDEYRHLGNYRYFGTDWERRASEIGTAAQKMVTP